MVLEIERAGKDEVTTVMLVSRSVLTYFSAVDIVKQKIGQACQILNELQIDAWIIFVRETSMMADPSLAMVVGHEATWQSFFIFTRSGRAVAMVGNLDAQNYRNSNRFDQVVTYTTGVKTDFCKLLSELSPGSIAINYSVNNVAADGLTHGMYLQLLQYLEGTPFVDRLVSSEELLSKLRSRKLPAEVDRVSGAGKLSVDIWNESVGEFRIGQTEKEIAEILHLEMKQRGVTPSFDTIVNAGDKTIPGHGLPSDAVLEPGDLLHVDFGVRKDEYCSDLQRLVYFRRPAEDQPPQELVEAFETVHSIITETGTVCKPGSQGFEIDQLARDMLSDNGYPEYQHALGHQIGRDVHDGGAILGPQWERYGSTPMMAIEENNLFTLELEINLPGIGCVGLEENIKVTESGGVFLCPRQKELTII